MYKKKGNIKEIIFGKSFSKFIEVNGNKSSIYQKTYLEYLVEDLLIKLKEDKELKLHLNSLIKVEFYDDNMINNINRIKLRYNFNIIFDKAFCKLITITPKDYDNIFEINEQEQKALNNKLNSFKGEVTKYKLLYLNFENNSPYQKNFIYFSQKYLKDIAFNAIIINNLGNINFEQECYDKIKDFKKIKNPFLEQIFFEKDLLFNETYESKEDIINLNKNNITEDKDNKKSNIKYFINSFFEFKDLLFIYEGYDICNNLIYYNIIKKITLDEIDRVFKKNNNIFIFKFVYEGIQIKYDRNNKHLFILNIKKEKAYIYNIPISFFTEFIKNFSELEELTIDGFDFTFTEIQNNNILSLNINILNQYSLNECNFIKDINSSKINASFKNLKVLKLSGNFELLEEIRKNINIFPYLKNIYFYLRKSDKKIKQIKNKFKKKNIFIEINPIYKDEEINNENYEEENEEDDYFDDEYEENVELLNIKGTKAKKNLNIKNPNLNEEKNNFNDFDPQTFNFANFDSDILKEKSQLILIEKGFKKIFKKKAKSLRFKKLGHFDSEEYGSQDWLIIIKTRKGKIFGAYSYKKFGNEHPSFTFDITNNLLYIEDRDYLLGGGWVKETKKNGDIIMHLIDKIEYYKVIH